MKRLLCLALFFGTLHASAFEVSGDTDYFIHREYPYSFIYSANDAYFVDELIKAQRPFKKLYEKEFAWTLDDPPYFILASPQNQIANGFVTNFPTLYTVYFGGGAAMVDDFAASSWLYSLLAHESAHFYQINAKTGYSSFLKSILGDAAPGLMPPFTYMIFPNVFLPSFMTEGNATFNENRFGNGGRLHNGVYRAIFLNLIAAGKVNPKRLINDHLDWPYGREKYIVGGYINLYLAEKHGIDKTNLFFIRNARHFINPFLLNRSFVETFGESYPVVFDNINAKYKEAAAKLQRVNGKIIAQSTDHGGFNRYNKKIMFLTSDDKTRPRFYQVKGNGEFENEKLNLPFGKPFIINNEIYVPSSKYVTPTQIRYSLFGEGMNPLPEFYDKFVYDIHNGQSLYGDIPKSFITTQLYIDQKFVDSVQSSAMFAPSGAFAYFKQDGETRKLMWHQNGTSKMLASYRGYYGVIVDILNDGEVYFVADVERGASLFRVNNGTIERVINADTVVDARRLENGQWLVAEVTDDGYLYKITQLETAKREVPAYYNYFFDTHETKKFFASVDTAPNGKPANAEVYSSTKEIKFDSINPMLLGFSDIGGFVGGLTVLFSDPMQYQNIAFTVFRDVGASNNASLMYYNRQYRINFDFGLEFRQSVVYTDSTETEVEDRFNEYSATIGAQLPLYRRGQISSTLSTRYTYSYEDTIPKYDWDIVREHSLLTEIDLDRAIGFGLAYDANSYQRVLLGHEIVRAAEGAQEQNVHYVGKVNFVEDIFWENFISAGYQSVLSEARFGDIRITDSVLDSVKSTEVTRFTNDTNRKFVQVNKVSAGYKKAINWGIYFTKFPLSLRRFAPFGIYQEFYGAQNRGDRLETLFHEWKYGVELELLLVHKLPFRFEVSKSEMNKREGSAFTALIQLQHSH